MGNPLEFWSIFLFLLESGRVFFFFIVSREIGLESVNEIPSVSIHALVLKLFLF